MLSEKPRKPANIQQLHQGVVEDLIRKIIKGDFRPNQLLSTENVLAEEYGVSRTVIREAVRLLVAKGMLSVRQGSGTRPLTSDHWDFLDPMILFEQVRSGGGAEMLDEILEMRRIIEGSAAALAAQRRTGEDVQQMRLRLEQMQRSLQHPADFTEQDILFHEYIMASARNRVLRGTSRQLAATLRSGRYLTHNLPGGIEHSLEGHQAIFEAIAAQAPQKAREAMLEHLAQFEHNIKISLLGEAKPSKE